MIILASSSLTRAKILKSFGIEFEQKSCDFNEESIKTAQPKSFVYQACKGKMQACEQVYGLSTPLLCADTVVTANNQILRKAKNEEEAREILLTQSGNEVDILTCMMYKSSELSFTDISRTKYIFEKFDNEDLENYIKSGVWRDKAGACMVEGFCKKYIKKVIGLESCAKGLQIEKLLPFLKDMKG